MNCIVCADLTIGSSFLKLTITSGQSLHWGAIHIYLSPYLVCINYPGQKRNLPGPCLSYECGACPREWITPHMDFPPPFLAMNNQSSGEGIKK